MTGAGKRQGVPYTEAQATGWLAWLARGMKRHGQTVFQIEQLQPSWLATRFQLQVYTLGSRLIGGTAVGLVAGIIVGIDIGLIMGSLSGLLAGTIDAFRFAGNRGRTRTSTSVSIGQIVVSMLSIGLPVWLLAWIVGGLIGGPFLGLTLSWIFGGLLAVTYGLRACWRESANDIRTTEALRWSWNRAARYGVVGASGGLLVGALAEVSYRVALHRPIAAYLDWWLQASIFVGLVGALCGVIFGGLDSGVVETKTAPNQGIRLSFRNAIFAGLVSGALIGVFGAVSADSVGKLLVSLTALPRLQGGLNFGLTGGLLVALWYGGIDILQHYAVRLGLFLSGHAPLNYVRFLDYAAEELNFLQKVGGGYVFIHRYLLEYFAGLEPGDPAPGSN